MILGKGLKQDPLVNLILIEDRLNTLQKDIKKDGKKLERLAARADKLLERLH